MFNNISYRTINILKYSSVALLFVIAASGTIYILSKQITEISQNIHTYNNISAQKQERIAISAKLSAEIEKIGAGNETALRNALVIDENISDIVQLISNLARKYSTSHTAPNVSGITRIAEINGAGKFTISSVDYSFQMDTNVDSFVRYLKELESNKNFIATTGFSISGDDKTGWNGNATINISGKIYYKAANQ